MKCKICLEDRKEYYPNAGMCEECANKLDDYIEGDEEC